MFGLRVRLTGDFPGIASHRRRRGAILARIEPLEDRRLLTLTPGFPIVVGTPQAFSGVGGNATSGGAVNAFSAFKAAIGGSDNGGAGVPQANGFRTINWDGVKVDGTDFGGDTTVINQGHTVGIPLNRFQERGIFFQEVYAVSNDGFVDVNPTVTGLFPAFSPSNTFAMFNENTIEFHFVVPSTHTTPAVPALSRGFGAIFLNVETPNTTSIEYFHGDTSLGKFFVPVGTQAQPEFLGELFNAPIVTDVTITLGTDTLFSFDGTNFSSSSSDSPPSHNLAVTDDFAYSEPQADPATPVITGTQWQTFSGVVGRFTDSDSTATAKSYTGLIDWGDGNVSPASFAANAEGGFDVSGTDTFAHGGKLPIRIEVQKFDSSGTEITLTNTANVAALPVLPAFPHKRSLVAHVGVALNNVVTATFTSVTTSAAADFQATIDWGDGITTAGTVIQVGHTFRVEGTHTYTTAGTLPLNVTITNAGGATFTANGKVRVIAPRTTPGRVTPNYVSPAEITRSAEKVTDVVELIGLT